MTARGVAVVFLGGCWIHRLRKIAFSCLFLSHGMDGLIKYVILHIIIIISISYEKHAMNHILQYYDYSRCFAYYTERIMSIRQAKIQGEVIVAKPVLMLALIDGIDEGVFTANSFTLNEWLETRYLNLMLEYTRQSQFAKPADIYNPFWHLATDGFWHLQLKKEADKGITPSRAWLKENVSNASFDEDLWVLFQNKKWRAKLREYIGEHKLTDGHWLRRLSEGLASLASLLMVA